MHTENSQLAERARRGDDAAVMELIELFYARIYAFLRRLTGNEADAADLTQRTFARVWQALPSFAGRSSVGSWIHSIAYHTYVDWRRGNHHSEPRPDQWWAGRVCGAPRPDELAARRDMAARIYTLVDALPAELRETVHLHYYQDLTLQETAAAMGVATSTVKYRLRQALSELETEIDADPTRADSPTNLKTI